MWSDGQNHFAEVTLRAAPGKPPSQVTISSEALQVLRSVFGADFEAQRHNVQAAVAAHIEPATRHTAEMPEVGATYFHAEIVSILVSGNAGLEMSGFLLSVAGKNAIITFLEDWISSQQAEGPRNRGHSTN